jgi:hypothetical protein
MKQVRLWAISAIAALSTMAPAQNFLATGFEPPMTTGDLAGQGGWMVTPSGAVATIQTTRVHEGLQALELWDAASFGRAQLNISGDLTQPILWARFAMYFDDLWDDDMEADRFEAQARIEGDAGSGIIGLEFGFVRAPSGGYGPVPGNGSAHFIEITTEESQLGAAYQMVDYAALANKWHVYDIYWNNQTDMVSLFVDGVLATQVGTTGDMQSVSGVQLQNQRWGTSPQRNAALFYDDVYVAGIVPEPATIAVLGIGFAALLRRRAKR